MLSRNVPEVLRHHRVPGIMSFATLAGIEATTRGTLVSVFPLAILDAMGSPSGASGVYFAAGVVSMLWGLLVPGASRFIPRRWMYSLGCSLYLLSMCLALAGTTLTIPLALLTSAMATATTFVCFNAYLLDYIERTELGRGQSTQMVFTAGPWTIGPVLGVWLYELWRPAPFLLAGAFACLLICVFWILRLGNGKQITRARRPAINPLGYLSRFIAQPRLIAGWSFAVIRSVGWWVYVVYLPYFCIEAGLGNKVGGIALSASNALMFLSPFVLRVARRASVRISVRMGFGICGALFFIAAVVSPLPWLTLAVAMLASVFLITLDVVAGLPFLMSVKPSERTEMSAVYSSFRDVSSVLTPGVAWLVLSVAPTAAIFAVCGLAMGGACHIARRLHPRLGTSRPSRGRVPAE
ncbi:MAG: MFS transporter [Rhodobacteraceae bacterium]|nr:MFS transporter [Paracoccaceae bacterium]